MADLKIDTTSVDTGVFFSRIFDTQLRRLLVQHEIGAMREYAVVRPSFGDTELSVSSIDAVTKKNRVLMNRQARHWNLFVLR